MLCSEKRSGNLNRGTAQMTSTYIEEEKGRGGGREKEARKRKERENQDGMR